MLRKLTTRLSTILYLLKTNIYYRFRFGRVGFRTVLKGRHQILGYRHIFIGDRCYLGDNLRMEAVTTYAGETFTPNLVVGDNVCINQNFHCTCAEKVVIGGGGTSVTANCGIFDIIHPYEDINENPRMAKIKTKPVIVGENCLIGMNSVIMPGTHLGNHCVIGANSTVSGIFPDYCVIAGSPAKVIKRYNFETKCWERV